MSDEITTLRQQLLDIASGERAYPTSAEINSRHETRLREQLADMTSELERARENMKALLRNVGGVPTHCRGCNAEITFVRHTASQRISNATQRLVPYNPDGVNHFITCPQAKAFRQHKSRAV
jgi:hypothetical protein